MISCSPQYVSIFALALGMQINTRRNQIAKSSVYFLLKKKIHQSGIVDSALDLGVMNFKIQDGKLFISSANYPNQKICLLIQAGEQWTYVHAETAHSIAYCIWENARRQFYPELTQKRRDKIILDKALEIWLQIDSWAN